jgi:hypothetical protein
MQILEMTKNGIRLEFKWLQACHQSPFSIGGLGRKVGVEAQIGHPNNERVYYQYPGSTGLGKVLWNAVGYSGRVRLGILV